MTDVCPVVKFGKHVSMADMITEHGISAVNTRPVHAKQMQVRGKVMGRAPRCFLSVAGVALGTLS